MLLSLIRTKTFITGLSIKSYINMAKATYSCIMDISTWELSSTVASQEQEAILKTINCLLKGNGSRAKWSNKLGLERRLMDFKGWLIVSTYLSSLNCINLPRKIFLTTLKIKSKSNIYPASKNLSNPANLKTKVWYP